MKSNYFKYSCLKILYFPIFVLIFGSDGVVLELLVETKYILLSNNPTRLYYFPKEHIMNEFPYFRSYYINDFFPHIFVDSTYIKNELDYQLSPSFFENNYSIQIIGDIFVSGDGSFRNYTHTFTFFPIYGEKYMCEEHMTNFGNYHKMTSVTYLETDILILGNTMHSYGDHINHGLLPGMLIPDWLKERRLTLLIDKNNIPGLWEEMLTIAGFKNLNVYQSSKGEYVYTNHLFRIKNYNSVFYADGLYARVALEKLFKIYGLDKKVEPYKYIVSNRKQRSRYIVDYIELRSRIKSVFSGYNWEESAEYFSDIIETMKNFWVVKFYFSPIGSGTVKCIFMQPNITGVVCLFTRPETVVLHEFCYKSLKSIIIRLNVSHNEPLVVDFQRVIYAISSVLGYLKNGRWVLRDRNYYTLTDDLMSNCYFKKYEERIPKELNGKLYDKGKVEFVISDKIEQ